jgi:hypothetical protein
MSFGFSRQNRLALVLGIAVACTLVFLVGQAWATSATLLGGEGSSWFVGDDLGTTNGQPTGGGCTSVPAGSGAATADASIPGQFDAFDFATMAWVDTTQVGGLMAAVGNEAIFAPVVISGLVAQMEYRALSTQSTLRVLLKLTNPSASTISVPVQYVNNFGSDGGTQIIASSSGDPVFGPDDRWLITDDGNTLGFDPTNTTVLYGPDSPPETTAATAITVFNCAGTEGSLARFELSIAPGTQQTLMFFQQLNPTATDAVTDSVQYDTTPPPGHPLTEGMTPDEFATIVNWDYGVDEVRVPQHFTGYATNTGSPRIPSETLTLIDQFGTETVRRAEPRLLMTPTSKQRPGRDVEPIERPDEHLKCYSLTGTIRQNRTVHVSNQFGENVELFVKEANRLCAPALKSEEPIPPDAEPEDTQHYKCYRVEERPRFSEDGVILEDQFREQVVDVRSAELLCNPVEKRRTGEEPVPPPRPDEHLVCYDFTERVPFPARNVFTRDQFGDQSLRALDPDLLCVPSTKEEIGDV